MSLGSLHDLAVLAATTGEKSKTGFYIAGGVLAAWAVLVAFLGLRQPEFPGRLGGQRIVMGISMVLVLGAMTAAVVTSSAPAKEHPKSASPASAPATPTAPAAGGASAAAVTHLRVAADPQGQLSFDAQSLKASAGTVKVRFANQAQLAHNFTIQQGTTTLAATPTITGSTATVSVTLKPGSYTFLCTVPGHAQAGMKGTLSVS